MSTELFPFGSEDATTADEVYFCPPIRPRVVLPQKLSAVCHPASSAWGGLTHYKDSAGKASPAEPKTRHFGFRLRPRGALTRSLEATAKASVWWRDLHTSGSSTSTARAWLDSLFEGTGVEALGEAKQVECASSDSGEPRCVNMIRVVVRGTSGRNGDLRQLWVCPELVAELTAVRVFRPLSEVLLATFRGRARRWAVEQGLPVMDLVHCLPGSLLLSALPFVGEVAAVEAMAGRGMQWSARHLGALANGQVIARVVPRWLSWLGISGERDAGAFGGRVARLSLPQ